MNIEKLFESTRLKMGATKKIRLADAAERSRIFNQKADKQFKESRMTRELLNKVIDL
mgnify:CR=1 FL=1